MNNTDINAYKKKVKKQRVNLPPPVIIMLGFLGVILSGSLLLMLPFAKKTDLPYLSSLFTSASAVCVAGLSVVNIAESFTLFGQIVIMLLIQIGGLGFMTITTLIFIFIKKKITLKERLALSEAYNQDNLQGLVRLTLTIIFFTFAIEGAGTVLLSFAFVPKYGFFKGVYFALFHSVSAFCNAGIDITGSSFTAYTSDILVNLSIMSLIFLGGLGFAVMRDMFINKRLKKFSFNTKVVLFTSLALIGTNALAVALAEWDNPKTFGKESVLGKILCAFFQAVTARTAGFNTIDQMHMSGTGKFITLINMFIGASPASTGGGLKTTTTFMLLLIFIKGLKGQEKEITFKGKSISYKAANKAVLLFIYSVLTVAFFTLMLIVFEAENNVPAEALLYETVSAFATVGLSFGITAKLTVMSKIFLIILMFIGRLGSLSLGLFILQPNTKEALNIRYPEAKLMIG